MHYLLFFPQRPLICVQRSIQNVRTKGTEIRSNRFWLLAANKFSTAKDSRNYQITAGPYIETWTKRNQINLQSVLASRCFATWPKIYTWQNVYKQLHSHKRLLACFLHHQPLHTPKPVPPAPPSNTRPTCHIHFTCLLTTHSANASSWRVNRSTDRSGSQACRHPDICLLI